MESEKVVAAMTAEQRQLAAFALARAYGETYCDGRMGPDAARLLMADLHSMADGCGGYARAASTHARNVGGAVNLPSYVACLRAGEARRARAVR